MDATKNFAVDGRWALLLHDLGLDSVSVLRRAGLPDGLFSSGATSLPPDRFYALWQAIEDESGDPDLPVKMGRVISTEMFSTPIFASLCSPNLRVAAERISTFKKLIGPMRLDVMHEHHSSTLRFTWPDGPEPPRIITTSELLFWVALPRLATRTQMRPLHLTAPDLVASDAFQEYAGVGIERADHYDVVYSASDMTLPFLTADEGMWESFEPDLRRRLSELETSATMGERVRAALLEMLPAGEASMDTVAEKLMMSSRTLQRRLKAEGTTFQAELNATRENLARHYLSSSQLPAAEISFLLGYDDPNSFYRAFHAWTGQTPDTVRSGQLALA